MYSSPSLALLYRPDLDVLTARWMAEPEPNVVRTEYAAVLDAGRQHGTVRWLVDVRRRPLPDPALAQWVTDTWLPHVATTLAPQRPRLAYLISPAREEALHTNPALQSSLQAALANRAYDLATFGDEGVAVQWLLAR